MENIDVYKILKVLVIILVLARVIKEFVKKDDKEIVKKKDFIDVGFEKSDEMTSEDIFWNLIQDSLNNTNSQDSQYKYLKEKLELMPPKEILSFELRKTELMHISHTFQIYGVLRILFTWVVGMIVLWILDLG